MGDVMPKEQYECIKEIESDCLERTNMTEAEAWKFAFRCWQLGYRKVKKTHRFLQKVFGRKKCPQTQ